MLRREFLSLAMALAQKSAKPNIVFFMADDLGYADLGCYGQKHIRTPNADKLAAEGMRFTDAYAGCTVCAPARSTLMTSMHMGHTAIRTNPGGVSIAAGDITIAQVLKKAGYRSGCFGKWGLGDLGSPGEPLRHGFDTFYGYLHQVHAHWQYPEYLIEDDHRDPLPANVGGKRAIYAPDRINERAIQFLRKTSEPFFCYIPTTLPHLELLAPPDAMAKYESLPEDKPYIDPKKHYADQPKPRAAYAAMVSRVDDYLGQVMAVLKERNLDSNTLVMFCSDNGTATPLWNDGNYFESGGPFRGHKQNFYEGGIRTPFLARWPGHIKAGAVSHQPQVFYDMLPTFAELAGVPPPAGIDGISIVPTLLGKGHQKQHEYLYWELPRYDAKNNRFFREKPQQAARMGNWKAVRPTPNAPLELYDLATDIGETKNLAASRPAVLKKMEEICETAHVTPREPQNQPSMTDFKLSSK